MKHEIRNENTLRKELGGWSQNDSEITPSANGRTWRERVVAHNLADMTFLSSISRTRRSFLKADVPVVVRLMGPFVVPIDEM